MARGPHSSPVSSCCTQISCSPDPFTKPQNMLNAAQIFAIVYCKSSQLSSASTSTSTLVTQLNVLSTPAAKLEISIHAPQCHFRECASSWQNFFIFFPPRSLCMQQREEIDMRATRNCQQYGWLWSASQSSVCPSLPHSSAALTYSLSVCVCGWGRQVQNCQSSSCKCLECVMVQLFHINP